MGQEMVGTPKRRPDAHGRELRRERIFARLREGWACDEIAREERLTPQRIRQIVREALDRRIVDDGSAHAKLQLARLVAAMRLAAEAVASGDIKAITSMLKVLDRLDRYQKIGAANQVYDDQSRGKLLDKINRVAANLQVDAPAPASDGREAGGPRAGAEADKDEKSPIFAASP